jgi:hypothetical protein
MTMSRKLSDSELHRVLDIFGYTSDRIVWAIEILQGRVDLKTIKAEHHPVNRKAYSLTDDQIREAAMNAAMEELRRSTRQSNNRRSKLDKIRLNEFDVDDEGFIVLPEGA